MITIYGELYSTKNSKRILKAGDRLFIAKSAVSKAHDKQIEQQLVIYRKKWESLCTGKKYPLKVIFKIYRKTKRRFDYILSKDCVIVWFVVAGYLMMMPTILSLALQSMKWILKIQDVRYGLTIKLVLLIYTCFFIGNPFVRR